MIFQLHGCPRCDGSLYCDEYCDVGCFMCGWYGPTQLALQLPLMPEPRLPEPHEYLSPKDSDQANESAQRRRRRWRNEYQKRYYAAHPEYRERVNVRARERYWRRKQERAR